MYLCDQDLRDLLAQLAFASEDGSSPFNPDEQIQPASVDLRLGSVFWRPLRRVTLDLRRTRLLEIQPRRYYRKIELEFGDVITIRPRELLLARTLEAFTVPNGYAGEIVGRSSFARLGLMVSATGSFINPGWRGRMPLQLVNFSPNAIRLVPGLPICQVRLTKLSANADRPYGHEDLESKYMDDDGGPSYWWRDKRIRNLHDLLSQKRVDERIQGRIDQVIGPTEPEVIERLEHLIAKTRVEDLQNADELLERFASKEDQRRLLRRWAINLSRALFSVGIAASLWVANKPPFSWWHYVVWGVGLLLVCLSVYAFRTEVGDHLGQQELRQRRGA